MSVTVGPRAKGLIREAVGLAIQRIVRAATDDPRDGTADGLASEWGVTEDTVIRWARGDGFPNYATAVRLAPLVGVDPESGKAAKA